MRFEIPQFIEVEDKVVGPFTWKQFLYIAGSGGLAFLFFTFLGSLSVIIKIILSAPFVAVGLAFAFLKVNERPFIFYIESFFYYLISTKKYLWKKKDENLQNSSDEDFFANISQAKIEKNIPQISKSRLKDIAWSLDIGEYNR